MSAEKKQYSLHLDTDLHRRVRVEAAQRGCQISEVVEEVLWEYFRQQKKQKKGKRDGAA